MPRILLVSDSPAIKSGMGRVVRELAGRFHLDGFTVAVGGWFELESPQMDFPYEIFDVKKYAPESLGPILAHFQPDVVLAIGDPWDFHWLAAHRRDVGGYKLIGYLNVEGEPLPLECEQILDGFDVVCASSEYGAGVVGRGVQAIHYGVDTEVFHPMPKVAQHYHGRDMAKTFVVFVNAQNTFRKNLAGALAGFAKFARGKDDVLCYFNTLARPGKDDAPGSDLIAMVVQLELERCVWFNPENAGPINTSSDAGLNGLYALADVLLVTSVGEGFGLPILEAMACGVPPIAPDAFSMPELIRTPDPGEYNRGYLMPVRAYIPTPAGLRVPVVADEDIRSALQHAYDAWQHREEILDTAVRVLAPDRAFVEQTQPGDFIDRVSFGIMRVQGLDFAQTKTWDRTYQAISSVCLEAQRSPRSRMAVGHEIEPRVRLLGRRYAAKHPGALGILKLGGLGDMLQTTAVVRAAAQKSGRPVVVFCNHYAEIFQAMPEVVEVVTIGSMPQQTAVDSLADEFELFLDVRYVSRAYGAWAPTEFSEKHRWFYDHWTYSSSRLATLGMHSTHVMLESLGLTGPIWPVYEPRMRPDRVPEQAYIAVATGVGVMGGLKRWPQENWAKLSPRLRKEHGVDIVHVGGLGDDAVDAQVMDYRGAGLPETAWLLQHASLLIAVEGGMAHLGAAVMSPESPVAVIFGPTPEAPFHYPGHVVLKGADLCAPCWQVEPTWKDSQCAIAQPSCVNFPSVTEVMETVKPYLPRQVMVEALERG